MAQIYRRMGKVDDAQKSLARAKELAPDSIEVLYNQALLYETQGKFKEAVQVITDAIASLNPSSMEGTLTQVTASLGGVFDTTALALTLSSGIPPVTRGGEFESGLRWGR